MCNINKNEYKKNLNISFLKKDSVNIYKSLYEETIEECISFNKKLIWNREVENILLADNAEDLIQVFKLRSSIYNQIGYNKEFEDPIKGLNFDKYDNNSAVLYYKQNNIITGTTRLIYDSKKGLPSEKIFSFSNLRKEYSKIGELSRLIIKNQEGLGLEFKNIMASIYYFFISNEIDITLLGIKQEHYKMYDRFGGSEIIQEIGNYGQINLPALILSWDPNKVSIFFKKLFLKK